MVGAGGRGRCCGISSEIDGLRYGGGSDVLAAAGVGVVQSEGDGV